MTVNSAMVKVAEWSDETGFTPVAAKYVRLKPTAQIEKNRTYVVTTIVVCIDINMFWKLKSIMKSVAFVTYIKFVFA